MTVSTILTNIVNVMFSPVWNGFQDVMINPDSKTKKRSPTSWTRFKTMKRNLLALMCLSMLSGLHLVFLAFFNESDCPLNGFHKFLRTVLASLFVQHESVQRRFENYSYVLLGYVNPVRNSL
jgi:hypothetical protein